MKEMKEKEIKIVINMVGSLPEKYLKYRKRIEQRIEDDVEEILGEYEIWGEFFGNDENVYAFFLEDVQVKTDEEK